MGAGATVKRSAFVCLVLTLLLAACGGSAKPPATALTILAVNSSVGRSVFHLDCGPVSGDVPDPARACAVLAGAPQLITQPKPFTCAGGTFSWWDVTITGRFDRKPIRRFFSTCWTPQMATLGSLHLGWSLLQKHLLPMRHVSVFAGTTHVFPPGALQAADVVTCDIRGHRLAMGVPDTIGPGGSVGYGGTNIVSVKLAVARRRDGSVSATCGDGS
jgi:hypothetical protein